MLGEAGMVGASAGGTTGTDMLCDPGYPWLQTTTRLVSLRGGVALVHSPIGKILYKGARLRKGQDEAQATPASQGHCSSIAAAGIVLRDCGIRTSGAVMAVALKSGFVYVGFICNVIRVMACPPLFSHPRISATILTS